MAHKSGAAICALMEYSLGWRAAKLFSVVIRRVGLDDFVKPFGIGCGERYSSSFGPMLVVGKPFVGGGVLPDQGALNPGSPVFSLAFSLALIWS
jgi:hypothetical protein